MKIDLKAIRERLKLLQDEPSNPRGELSRRSLIMSFFPSDTLALLDLVDKQHDALSKVVCFNEFCGHKDDRPCSSCKRIESVLALTEEEHEDRPQSHKRADQEVQRPQQTPGLPDG